MYRFCAKLELPIDVQRTATYIVRAALEYDIVRGKSPISVAAAAIYMASQVRTLLSVHMYFRDLRSLLTHN